MAVGDLVDRGLFVEGVTGKLEMVAHLSVSVCHSSLFALFLAF